MVLYHQEIDMIWFTSDTHFGHTGVLMHQSDRLNAFKCIEEMDAQMIDQINCIVRPNDELYHLGDFCWRAGLAGHYRQRLNVRRLYICRGNHDANSLKNHVSLMDLMLFRKFNINGDTVKIHMCHYPLLSWGSLYHGGLHLYGHSHGKYEAQLDEIFPERRSMDVGIDVAFKLTGMWRPFCLDEVIERLGARELGTTLPGPFESLEFTDLEIS